MTTGELTILIGGLTYGVGIAIYARWSRKRLELMLGRGEGDDQPSGGP